MIDISDIHMIQVVADVGSINKAAELLNMSQPTLSKKVSRLEQKLNLELFSRGIAGMVPTEAANLLIEEGSHLKDQLRKVERQLELMSYKKGGVVKLGVGPIVEQILLPKVLLDYVDQNYDFKIQVTTMSSEALLKQLRKGAIDLAIGPFVESDIPDDMTSPLYLSEKIIGAVRSGHDLSSKGAALTLDAFTRFKAVTPDIPAHMGHQISRLLENTPLEPEIVCENYAMAKTIVSNSDYITAGPESLFRTEFTSGELSKLEFPIDVNWNCMCIGRPETLLIPIVKEIVSIFSQYMDAPEV